MNKNERFERMIEEELNKVSGGVYSSALAIPVEALPAPLPVSALALPIGANAGGISVSDIARRPSALQESALASTLADRHYALAGDNLSSLA